MGTYLIRASNRFNRPLLQIRHQTKLPMCFDARLLYCVSRGLVMHMVTFFAPSSRNLFPSILMACLLTVLGCAASAGQYFTKPGESATNNVIEIKQRGRGPWPNLPIAPSYLAYDWPYYYNRGHYPTHIGPGYVYYGYPYYYRRSSYYKRYGGICSYWPAKSLRRAWVDARRCVGN
jgi:hypothetical protein